MQYDVQFRTRKTNVDLIEMVKANVDQPPTATAEQADDHVTLVWRCDAVSEAEQIEARVKGALHYTIGVQPAPEVDSGAIPPGSSTLNPAP